MIIIICFIAKNEHAHNEKPDTAPQETD